MWIKSKDHGVFVPACCEESGGELLNPGCGWYHVYHFQAQPPAEGQPVDEEIWLDESCRQEQLALVLIDMGAFQMAPLSEAALLRIGQILDFFRRNQKQVLLRFAYDTQGKGLEQEPPTLAWILGHMEQIGGALGPYWEDILVMQGLFVGSWGEMHDSKFLDEASLCRLFNTLYGVIQGRCFLAVRTPAQWREIAGSPKVERGAVRRLGLFNDGIFGSPTDLGTYGTLAGAGKTEKWPRPQELDWQDRHVDAVPNGGEVLSCYPLKGFRQAEADLRKMHVSYLNSVYHPAQLDHWKKEAVEEPGCWQGVSGYDYIGRHLGYRFSVADVAETWGHKLRITIKNSGFANLCQEAECFLVVKGAQGETRLPVDTDAREWKSGGTTALTVAVPPEARGAGSQLSLQLRRRSDGRVLRFANVGAEDSVPLGEFR